MNSLDPISEALRDLVRSKLVHGWRAMDTAQGRRWTVSYYGDYGLVTPPPFTTDEVVDLIPNIRNLHV